MGLNNIKTNQKGFTIVELLIVIVVIGILAAITIVAFNGIQNRGKTASGQQLASNISKKAEAYQTIQSKYPTLTELTSATAPSEAKLDDPAVVVAGPIVSGTADSGKKVGYAPCPATGTQTGALITYYDFTNSSVQSVKVGTGTC